MGIEEYLLYLHLKQRLLQCSWSDVRVCVNPDWHRKEWYHAGNQVYLCKICQRLEREVA
jgi:hypothetical protein